MDNFTFLQILVQRGQRHRAIEVGGLSRLQAMEPPWLHALEAARSTSAQIQACLGQLKAQVAIGSLYLCQPMEQYYQQVNLMETFGQAPTLAIRGTQSRMTGNPSLLLQMVVRSSQLLKMDRSTRQVTCKYSPLSSSLILTS